MTTRIETENATYEVDFENKRARIIEGDTEDNSQWPEDHHVWREYTDTQNLFGRFYVVWPDSKAFLSSGISSAEEVA